MLYDLDNVLTPGFNVTKEYMNHIRANRYTFDPNTTLNVVDVTNKFLIRADAKDAQILRDEMLKQTSNKMIEWMEEWAPSYLDRYVWSKLQGEEADVNLGVPGKLSPES